MLAIDPWKSKLGALMLKRDIDFRGKCILYLGAGAGTTASLLSEEAKIIYCVEPYPSPMSKLLERVDRDNVIPIMESARSYWGYMPIVDRVDILYQDVAQRDQGDIFCKNFFAFDPELGILIVKGRSISQKGEGLNMAKSFLDREGLSYESYDLAPYARDHTALVVT
jgi:fibrillarin-like pre-rRNA processing protein